jgi:hypothetical protein
LAARLREDSDGLYTPSARRVGGACVPVFTEKSVSEVSGLRQIRLHRENGSAQIDAG